MKDYSIFNGKKKTQNHKHWRKIARCRRKKPDFQGENKQRPIEKNSEQVICPRGLILIKVTTNFYSILFEGRNEFLLLDSSASKDLRNLNTFITQRFYLILLKTNRYYSLIIFERETTLFLICPRCVCTNESREVILGGELYRTKLARYSS